MTHIEFLQEYHGRISEMQSHEVLPTATGVYRTKLFYNLYNTYTRDGAWSRYSVEEGCWFNSDATIEGALRTQDRGQAKGWYALLEQPALEAS